MLILTSLVLRIVVLSISFVLATMASAAFLTFALFLGGDLSWLRDDLSVVGGTLIFGAASWFTIANLVFFPALIAIVILEYGYFKSLLINATIGGLIAIYVLLMYTTVIQQELNYPVTELKVAIIAAGFVGGITHWMIAGHRAGRWRGSLSSEEA